MKRLLLVFALIISIAKAADQWDAPHMGNPILPGYYADPSLVQDHGKYYLYATIDPWGGRTLGCWESSDFKNWTFRVLNWPTKAACTSPDSHDSMVWAPSVLRAPNGKFYMYVSVGSEVWVGTADQPLGPWRDAHGGTPLISAKWNPAYHMIDAEGFIDEDGSAYLYWGSGWEWKNGHCFAVKLKPDLVSFDGVPRDVTPAGHYFEGPFMLKNQGKYYLMYSHGITMSDSYSIHYAIGNSPLGPFIEASNTPILTTDKEHNVISPGHHAVFRHDGHTYILYHRHRLPYVPDTAFRQTCVDELHFSADGLIEKVIPTHAGPELIHGRATRSHPNEIATASSELDVQHGAKFILDDNYATRWEAAANDLTPWLKLDLGSVKTNPQSEIRFEYAWQTYHFVLESSQDGTNWKTVEDHRGDGVSGSPVRIKVDGKSRYLRLSFAPQAKGQTNSVFEWQVE